MDKEVTLGQPETLLSLDDLVMKIGSLTVELLQAERAIANTKQTAQATVAPFAAEAARAKAEAEELRAQLKQAEAYKGSHDAASKKLHELSDAIASERARATNAEAALADASARAASLTARVAELEAELAARPKGRRKKDA